MGNICCTTDTQQISASTTLDIVQKRNSEQLDLMLQETETKLQALMLSAAAKEHQFSTLQKEANDAKARLQLLVDTQKKDTEVEEIRVRHKQQAAIRLIVATSIRYTLAFSRWKMLMEISDQAASQRNTTFFRKVAAVLENVQESAVQTSFSILITIHRQERSHRFSSRSLEPLPISEDLQDMTRSDLGEANSMKISSFAYPRLSS